MAVLLCQNCGFEQPVPTHCGGEMTVKSGLLVCEACGLEAPIPTHCGAPMSVG